MNNVRRVSAGLLMALLLISPWSAVRSKDQSGSGRVRDVRAAKTAQSAQKNVLAKPQAMSAEEKIVRDVYARLMRYQSAAIDEKAASTGEAAAPTDFLTYSLRNIHSGFVSEIQQRPLSEFVTDRSGDFVELKAIRLSQLGGPPHAYYDAAWATAPTDQQSKGAQQTSRFAGFNRYTSYEVKVELNGKKRIYRALAVYRLDNGNSAATHRPAQLQILDNITVDVNEVYRDESPRTYAPWNKYVRTGLYRAVAASIKEKKQNGTPLIPDNAPIGYLPGDDAVAAYAISDEPVAPIDGGGGDGGGGGGGGGTQNGCLNIMIKKADDSSLPSPFRIGITANGHNRTQHLKAVVFPFADAANVTISVTSGITLSNVSPNSSTGVITFDVVGKTESTAKGDQTIAADHTSGYSVTQSVTVVVPSKVGTPHDTQGGGMAIANRVLDATTSPAAVGLQPGQVALVTTYLRFVNVVVWDRFNEPIGTIYQGAEVFEGVTINQFLSANSTYLDPVGFVEIDSIVQAGSAAAQAWPSQPLIPLQHTGSTVQNIAVQVDGFALNPAIVNRTVTLNPPNSITITWP